jgi:hypothetical protein
VFERGECLGSQQGPQHKKHVGAIEPEPAAVISTPTELPSSRPSRRTGSWIRCTRTAAGADAAPPAAAGAATQTPA